MTCKNNKVGVVVLIALVVGSMIGSGLFDLPSDIALRSALAPTLIGWSITFIGMLCLALVFKELSLRKPNLDAGIYAYAKAGFGDYMGFNSAWGYWISAWMGNVAFVIMLCSSLSAFLPIFGDGTNSASLIVSSILIWSITALCAKGVKSASFLNLITTAIKVIAILIFIAFVIYGFDFKVFNHDIWGVSIGTTVFTQVKETMLITLWVFIGIESACVFSGRAKKRQDIGHATVIGFLVVFVILFMVSVLPFGIFHTHELATLSTPSTAGILEHIVGSIGKKFIDLAMLIAILGALLAWILLAAEVPYTAAVRDRLFPKIFAKTNATTSPIGSLYVTALFQQIYIIIAYFSHSGYLKTLSLATAMIIIPYFLSAAYSLMLSVTGKTYEYDNHDRIRNCIVSSVALLYCAWLLYAAGVYLLLSTTLYVVGTIVYIATRISSGSKIFTRAELVIVSIILIAGLYAISSL